MKSMVITILGVLLAAGDLSATVTEQDVFSSYGIVLTKFVDDDGWVDYADLKIEREPLDTFVKQLAVIDRENFDTWDAESQIAFWINAYNGLTLSVIIDHYPIRGSRLKSLIYPASSIRHIPGAWDSLSWVVMGEEMTLDHIEHGILRKNFSEPRIHVALVCAAVSCPPLRNEPFAGAILETQLDAQVRAFLSRANGLRIDRVRKEVRVSTIFSWFGGDFVEHYGEPLNIELGDKPSAFINFIAQHVDPDTASYLLGGDFEVKYFDYDWTLNDQPE